MLPHGIANSEREAKVIIIFYSIILIVIVMILILDYKYINWVTFLTYK